MRIQFAPSLAPVIAPHRTSARFQSAMQLGRYCGTVHLDRRANCLSTFLFAGNGKPQWGKIMWQRLSLRGRINVLLALILTLGLAINVARLALEAAPRVQAEDQSVTRLAREFIQTMVAALNEAPDPNARLDQIVHDLKRLRHAGTADEPAVSMGGAGVAWFVALVHPEK